MAYNKFYKNKRRDGELWKSLSSPKELKENDLEPASNANESSDFNLGLRKQLIKAMSSS